MLKQATSDQAQEICDLINLAYRGDQGWTSEGHLISGPRSPLEEALGYIQAPDAHLLVSVDQGRILGCICIEAKQAVAHIGYFAVHPELQGQGLGKAILRQAEEYAYQQLGLHISRLLVIPNREELIDYYVRRGYTRTGILEPFPFHRNVGSPVIADLQVEQLDKHIAPTEQ